MMVKLRLYTLGGYISFYGFSNCRCIFLIVWLSYVFICHLLISAVEGSVVGTRAPKVVKKGKSGLIVATVLSLLIVIAVIVSALYYCK